MRADASRSVPPPNAPQGAKAAGVAAQGMRSGPPPPDRPRIEASGRRSQAVSQLVGAMVRKLRDSDGEESIEAVERDVDSGAADRVQVSADGHASTVSPHPVAMRGVRTRPSSRFSAGIARAKAASPERELPVKPDVWASDRVAPEGSGTVEPSEARVRAVGGVPRLKTGRPGGAVAVRARSPARFAAWGALLAAVAVLGVMLAAGWVRQLGEPAPHPGQGAQPQAGSAP